MPLYEFQGPGGERADHFYSMAEAPPIGTTVEIDGISWTRVPSLPTSPIVKDRPFTGHQFGAEEGIFNGHDYAPRRDAEGKPQFDSKTERERFTSAWNDHHPHEKLQWDQ